MQNDSVEVCCMISVEGALDSFMKQEYCLVILDWQVAGSNGLEMLNIMRTAKRTPILVIANDLESEGKVALFQAGADAYLEKPVDMSVCAAQAGALIQLFFELNQTHKACCPLTFGMELVISPLYRQVIIDGTSIELTRTEFDLLFCLAQHPGQVWSRSQLYSHVWADDLGASGDNTVRAHIGNLRKKLADMGKDYIQTSRGIGYKFVPPAAKQATQNR